MKEYFGSEMLEVVIDLSEVLLDQSLADGLLREIPILNTMVSIAQTAKTVPDLIFLKKVHRFVYSLPKIEDEEKERFLSKLENDKKMKNKVGEIILLMLDRFSDMEKPEILAKVFSAYVSHEIDFDVFHRLSIAIDLAYIADLKHLADSDFGEFSGIKENLLRTRVIASNLV